MKPGDVFNPHGLFHGIFIPEALVKYPKVSPGAKLAYGRLVRFGGEDGKCYPSLKTLSREVGISKRQGQRYMDELKTARLIRVQPRISPAGAPDTGEVVFLWHVLFEAEGVVTDVSIGSDTNVHRVVTDVSMGVVTDMSTKESQLKRVREEKNSLDRWFADFWQLYPRKTAKAAAFKAAKSKATTEANRAEITAGLKAQLPELRSREPHFIPHASTWLNQERWTDEPEPASPINGRGPAADRYRAKEDAVMQSFTELVERRLGDEVQRRGPAGGEPAAVHAGLLPD